MKVILINKDDINLKKLNKKIEVKNGYARNYLIPYGKAIIANKRNIYNLQKDKIRLKLKLAEDKLNAIKEINKIKKLKYINIYSRVTNKKKLFGSIGIKNIYNKIKSLGINILKKNINIPHNVSLKTLGKIEVEINIYKDVSTILLVNILEKKNNIEI